MTEQHPGSARARTMLVDSVSLGPALRVAPTWTESIARQASRPFGGRLGRHAQVGRQRFWTPLRVILLLATLMLAAGWLFRAPCLETSGTGSAAQIDWSNNRQYLAMCYTDIIPRYEVGDLAPPNAFPYKTPFVENAGTPKQKVRYMEYPVITGLFQWANARLTDGLSTVTARAGLPASVPGVSYFDITAFWLTGAWLTTVWALVKLGRQRVWDASLAALSPLVFVHVFTNFDALATALATTGLLAWARRRPALAGVLIGLGCAAKLYPVLFLGPILLLCLRSGQIRRGLHALVAAACAWSVVNLPIMILFPRGWAEFFLLNTERPADPDSLYNVASYFTGWPGFDGRLATNQAPAVLNSVSLALFLVACVAIAWLALAAPARPRLASLCFLVVAAFLVTNKVWSPQYSLWLVPLGVLAIPRWRVLLSWMLIDALVWAPRMYYYLGVGFKGLPEGWFLGAVVIRDLAVLGLCALIVREILNPRHDRVRATLALQRTRHRTVADDPCGGFLDGADDRFRLPGLPAWPRRSPVGAHHRAA